MQTLYLLYNKLLDVVQYMSLGLAHEFAKIRTHGILVTFSAALTSTPRIVLRCPSVLLVTQAKVYPQCILGKGILMCLITAEKGDRYRP